VISDLDLSVILKCNFRGEFQWEISEGNFRVGLKGSPSGWDCRVRFKGGNF